MTLDGTRAAQAALFCTDLHRHIAELDAQASMIAGRLRNEMGLRGRSRRLDLIGFYQGQLRGRAAERRRVMEMLAAMGHGYPCSHR